MVEDNRAYPVNTDFAIKLLKEFCCKSVYMHGITSGNQKIAF